jgi:hypothetical protein
MSSFFQALQSMNRGNNYDFYFLVEAAIRQTSGTIVHLQAALLKLMKTKDLGQDSSY